MARIDNELLKNCKGRLGEFVVYQCKGKTYIRKLPEKESVKLTQKMLEQQERVAGIAALYQSMKACGMDRIWKEAATGTGLSGYQLLIRTNSPAFSGKGVICDFHKLTLATGKLQLPDHLNLTSGQTGEYIFTWENGAMPYPFIHENDRLVVALMKTGKSFAISIPHIGDWERKHCRAVIRLPTELRDYHHLYCYFSSVTGEAFSESVYFSINHSSF